MLANFVGGVLSVCNQRVCVFFSMCNNNTSCEAIPRSDGKRVVTHVFPQCVVFSYRTMRQLSDLQAEIERRDTDVLSHIDYSKELTNTNFSVFASEMVDDNHTIRELTRENESLRVEIESYLDMAQRGGTFMFWKFGCCKFWF